MLLPHPQAWIPSRPALNPGPSTLLLLLALVPTSHSLSPEMERQAPPDRESLELGGSQVGDAWNPKARDNQQKISPDLDSKEIRFPNQQGPRGPKHTCRPPGFWSNSQSQWYIFGEGTKLTVLGQPKASPMVMAYAPSLDELQTTKATLVCLINGFYPDSVEVTWTKNGSPVSSGVHTSKPARQSDNKYSASSYLSLDANQWGEGNTYICKVTHEGQVIQKELSPSQCT